MRYHCCAVAVVVGDKFRLSTTYRKIISGFRSDRGAVFRAGNLSVVVTAKRRGIIQKSGS